MSENDKQLIEDFQEGDEFAFISIYNRYKTPLYAFCVKMLGDQEQARDVMQETFLRVYENRHRLSNSGAFKAWIFTIARNQCLNQIRRARWQVPFEDEREATTFAQETPVSRSEERRVGTEGGPGGCAAPSARTQPPGCTRDGKR